MRGQNAPQKLRSYFVVLMTLFTIGLPYSGKFFVGANFCISGQKAHRIIFVCFNFVCQSYKTTPMQLTYGLQHSMVILLQVYEPF